MPERTDGGTQESVVHQRGKELRRLCICANTSRVRWTSPFSNLLALRTRCTPSSITRLKIHTFQVHKRIISLWKFFVCKKIAGFLFVRKKPDAWSATGAALYSSTWSGVDATLIRTSQYYNKALIAVIKHGYPCVAWTLRVKCETFEASRVANVYRWGPFWRTPITNMLWALIGHQQPFCWSEEYTVSRSITQQIGCAGKLSKTGVSFTIKKDPDTRLDFSLMSSCQTGSGQTVNYVLGILWSFTDILCMLSLK